MTKGNLNDLIRTEANKEVESQSSPSPKRPKETNATLQAKINDLTTELEKTEKNQQTLQERLSLWKSNTADSGIIESNYTICF